MPEAARPADRANPAVDLDGAAARRVLPCVLAAQAEFVRVADRHLGDEPTRPSRLAGWTQAQLAAHVAYGAEALQRITRAALRGVHEPFYPRPGDRDRSIERGRHLPTAVLRAELAASASALAETWLPLSEADWTRLLRDDRFPGATLARHLVLRWHEVEVHRHDFVDRTNWRQWSDEFVATALPLRLSWQPLARRLPSADQSVDGHWAFAVLGEPEAWVVTADGPAAHVSRSPRDAAQADASLEGPAAAVLAFLLGRAPADCLHTAGARSHAERYKAAFPGP